MCSSNSVSNAVGLDMWAQQSETISFDEYFKLKILFNKRTDFVIVEKTNIYSCFGITIAFILYDNDT